MFFTNSYTSCFILYKKRGLRSFASCQRYTVLPSTVISSALSPSLLKIILREISGLVPPCPCGWDFEGTWKHLPGPRSSWSCLGTAESRQVRIPPQDSLRVILCLPEGGRASKRFWRRMAPRGVGSHSNRSKPFQTCAGLSEVCSLSPNQHFFPLLFLVVRYLAQASHHRARERVMYHNYYIDIWKARGGNPSVWRIWSNKIKSLVYIQGSAGWLNICNEHIKLPPLSRETLTYGIWIYSLLI